MPQKQTADNFNPIDFSVSPKVFPYVADLVKESHMSYYSGRKMLDEETFIRIVEEWVDFYEKNIEQTVENTFKVFELTYGESSISQQWSDWNGKHPNRITKETIRKYYRSYFVACIAHLHQKSFNKFTEVYHGGATGMGMYCKFTLNFHESELKRVKHQVSTYFQMGLDLSAAKSVTEDVYK